MAIFILTLLFCSGYADRIHELMVISRELGAHDVSTLQTNGGRNFVSEANYIEFDDVKVRKLSLNFQF